MKKLVKLTSNQTHENALAVLLDLVKDEITHFKLAMLNCNKLTNSQFQVTGFCSEDYCPIYTAEQMLYTSPDFPILMGGFVEDWKLESEPKIISAEDCPGLFQADLSTYNEAIVIPIWMNGRINRWIVIVDYSLNSNDLDIERLSLILNFALTNIIKTEQKRQLDKARKWIDDELKEISRIQSLLLPHNEVKIDSLKVAFKFKAFKDAGGDYLDISQLPSPKDKPDVLRWGGVIADVTGHGPSAAVEAAMLDAILRTFPGSSDGSPADVTEYVNKHFFTRRDRGKFITAKFFLYSDDTKLLTYVSAGHPLGFIKRGDEIIVLDQSQGIPIGVMQDYKWVDSQVKMYKDDILFIYTDVVLETRSPSKEEYGEVRLIETLKNAPNCPHMLVDAIEKELLDFSGGRDLKDDLTLLALMIEK